MSWLTKNIPPTFFPLLCFLPPSLAWGYYNSLQRKSIASFRSHRSETLLLSLRVCCADWYWAASKPASFKTSGACLSNFYTCFSCILNRSCMTTPVQSGWVLIFVTVVLLHQSFLKLLILAFGIFSSLTWRFVSSKGNTFTVYLMVSLMKGMHGCLALKVLGSKLCSLRLLLVCGAAALNGNYS